MTLTTAVNLPSAVAVGGGVLAQARPLPDSWTRGVQFATEACLIAGSHQFCPDSPGEKTLQGTDIASFDPLGIELSVACTTLTSEVDRLNKARAALLVVAEYNVGAELATGTVTGNPSLADAVGSGSASTAADALSVLEGLIAENLRGHLAWVHVAPSRLTQLVAADVVYRDAMGDWRTPTGHLVVASPGYETPLADVLVATPEVFADLGDPEQIRFMAWKENQHQAVHEAPGLAVFDPCFNVSVSITDSP